MAEDRIPPWLAGLEEEDFQFIKRFLLASGSLKELAAQYGISYPTVRLRLDRLIERIRTLDEARDQSPFYRMMRLLVAEGQLEPALARKILRGHQGEIARREEENKAGGTE